MDDELDEYLAEAMTDPGFRAAYESAGRWQRADRAGPLSVDGRAYRRRQRARGGGNVKLGA